MSAVSNDVTTAPPPLTGAPPFVRRDFPALEQTVNGRPLAYLDNAATTQKPRSVIEAMRSFYATSNANVHRGVHELSERATRAYEDARARTAAFFGIADPAELVWTRGTTEALNLVAWSWGGEFLREGDEVLLTVMEHHSNLVPWQLVAQRTGARLRFIELDEEQRLDLSRLGDLINPRTKVVSLCHVSNALGTINPVAEIAEQAHRAGAIVVVDGAQSCGHLGVRVEELGCDFYAFSGHKMYGPTGVGGLWGRRELLEAMSPWQGGGDMIDLVELERSTFAELPHKFEAGTPNIAGVVGLGAAVDYLTEVGWDAIAAHEREVLGDALERVRAVPGIRVYGPRRLEERSGVISFTLGDVHPHDLATILDSVGVAIRAGHHCTQPLMRLLEVPATARASFAMYTSAEDVDQLIEGLNEARRIFGLGGEP